MNHLPTKNIAATVRRRSAVSVLAVLSAHVAQAALPINDLSWFYVQFPQPVSAAQLPPEKQTWPQVQVIGGTANPSPLQVGNTRNYTNSVQRLTGLIGFDYAEGLPPVGIGTEQVMWERVKYIAMFPTWTELCDGWVTIPRAIVAGQILTNAEPEKWDPSCAENLVGARSSDATAPSPFIAKSNYTVLAPLRRKAIDGGQYDASPMIVWRNEAAWYSHFWGYRMGLVANESNFNIADRSKFVEQWPAANFPSERNNFELTTLPPPWVEDDVVEYVNQANFPLQPGGQYFYAVRAEDKTLLDSLPVWQRTGKGFKSGGYVSACRYYGGKNGGPNTHFYSADDKECALLKTIPQLSYEGQTFAVNMPLPGVNADGTKPCPIDSKPLYRVYNNASASNGRFVSNHRYFTERADVATVVAQGWVDEGQVMCVPQ